MEEKIKAVAEQVRADMQALGTYRKEFEATILRYSQMKIEYDVIHAKWVEDGCPIVEEFTNKSGATCTRKPPSYTAVENLRKDLLSTENILGLTPKGIKQIRQKSLEAKKESALDRLLNE